MAEKRFTIKTNNIEKIEQLLQETYNLACQQYTLIQDEMNKIASTTKLKDLDIEGKEKYAKAMSNYISLQQKSISQKFDIAKLMAEIVKHNGDIGGALNDMKKVPTTLDIEKLKRVAMEAQSNGAGEIQVYKTKS